MQIEIERKNRNVVGKLDKSEDARFNDAAFRVEIRDALGAAFMKSGLDSADLLVRRHNGCEFDTSDWSPIVDSFEPGDPCPNNCGEALLAGSPSGNGRIACDRCQTYWD